MHFAEFNSVMRYWQSEHSDLSSGKIESRAYAAALCQENLGGLWMSKARCVMDSDFREMTR